MNYRVLLFFMLLVTSLSFGLIYSCGSPENNATAPSNVKMNAGFVGDQQCKSCHSDQFSDWQGSHHDYAMKEATEESVRGDFDDVTFNHRNESYRFFKQDNSYWVEYRSASGKQTYQIAYTFGWEPLQQYLVKFGKGKLQALNIAWDTQDKQWFALNPEEDLQHGGWLHWTGGAMNWNTMCADCHSTNLQQNYVASADSFHTTWSSINVSCESCHGPGRAHVAFAKSEQVNDATIERIREDLNMTGGTSQIDLINGCASCHSLREKIAEGYARGEEFMDVYNPTLPHPDMYFGDGQIKGEVYVYGSFLQSKMFKNDVECTDCHDPHTLELKANVTDNSLCLQCHQPSYNTRAHTFHEPNTESSQCVSCHMPGRYYMEVDFRRDHSFRVPRPDLSAKFGTPNACNSCHEDRSASWAAEIIRKEYGPDRPDHFSETLLKADSVGEAAIPDLKQLIADTSQPAIARSTAIWYLGRYPSEENAALLETTIHDPRPLIRKSTAQALAQYPGELKMPTLQDGLDDSVRAVRVIAAGGLAEFSQVDMLRKYRKHFTKSLDEYRAYLALNQYFPQGAMNRGQFFEKRGETQKAIQAYQEAIKKDSLFNPARMNLAFIYNSQGKNSEAERLLKKVIEQEPQYGQAYYSLALLLAEGNKYAEAIRYFETAAQLMADNPRVFYNWALALQTVQRYSESEQAYLHAVQIDSENPEYHYGLFTLYMQQKQYESAYKEAKKLVEILPGNARAKQLLKRVEGLL